MPGSCRSGVACCHLLMHSKMRASSEVSREYWQDMPCDMEGVELAEVAVPLPMDIAVGGSCSTPLVM